MRGVKHQVRPCGVYVFTVLAAVFMVTPIICAQEQAQSSRVNVSVQLDELKKPGDLGTTKTILARLLPKAPQIDGNLSEDTWDQAGKINTLHPAGTQNLPELNTQVYVGHLDNVLYIGVTCQEPDRRRRIGTKSARRDQTLGQSNAIEILLDSRHGRTDAYAVLVDPSGSIDDYWIAENSRRLDWDSNCTAAGSRTRTGWSIEVAIPRASFETPENDIIGFNVVRLRSETEGAPFTWNPAPEAFENGIWLGNLSFETRPVSIQKVEVGWPYVGLNRIRVWLRNETPHNVDVRLGLAGARADTKIDRSRYQLTVPAGKVVAYALSHRYGAAGNYGLVFALLPKTSDESIARFFRPDLTVASTSLILDSLAKDKAHNNLTSRFRILMPIQELEGVRMVATLRREGEFTTLGKEAVRALASRRGTITLPTATLPAGTYQFDLYLSRQGKVLASERKVFTLPMAGEATENKLSE